MSFLWVRVGVGRGSNRISGDAVMISVFFNLNFGIKYLNIVIQKILHGWCIPHAVLYIPTYMYIYRLIVFCDVVDKKIRFQ